MTFTIFFSHRIFHVGLQVSTENLIETVAFPNHLMKRKSINFNAIFKKLGRQLKSAILTYSQQTNT